MTAKNRTRRFLFGFSLALVLIIAGFSIANGLIPNWGSTPEEQSRALPGDEIFPQPVTKWTHAITINAAPEAVWPWLIQMGDTRGGFYSYRYVEKAVMLLFGANPALYYNNAASVHPEWQSPTAGDGMIMDTLVLRDFKANQYVIAGPKPEMSDGGLLWTWYIEPAGEGRTRLIVHMLVQIPGMQDNKAIDTAMNLATFMMGRKMMDGIKLRAEGGAEADWVQVAEALVWFAALAAGIAAAQRFMTRSSWKFPLAVGLASIAALFVMVYLQPALWLRVLIDLGLVGALVWEQNAGKEGMKAAVSYSVS